MLKVIPDSGDRHEINVDGKEYSVYAKLDFEINTETQTPSKSVVIPYEIYDAETTLPVDNNSALGVLITESLEEQINHDAE